MRGFAGAAKIATREAAPAITTYLYCNVGDLYLSLCLSRCFESNMPKISVFQWPAVDGVGDKQSA